MLVTFTTKAYADITMFGDVGLSMLRMMGHSGTVPGAIVAEDIPDALAKLRQAVDAEKPAPQTTEDDDDEPVVSLHQRALPLLELLAAAEKDGADVMWK